MWCKHGYSFIYPGPLIMTRNIGLAVKRITEPGKERPAQQGVFTQSAGSP